MKTITKKDAKNNGALISRNNLELTLQLVNALTNEVKRQAKEIESMKKILAKQSMETNNPRIMSFTIIGNNNNVSQVVYNIGRSNAEI